MGDIAMGKKMEYSGKYHLSRFEFGYAKWFALKYPEWLEEYNRLKDSVGAMNYDKLPGKSGKVDDSTARLATKRAELREKMLKVERCAFDAGGDINEYILKSVIYEDVTFDDMKAAGMPAERTMFYERRRKFYFLLSQMI